MRIPILALLVATTYIASFKLAASFLKYRMVRWANAFVLGLLLSIMVIGGSALLQIKGWKPSFAILFLVLLVAFVAVSSWVVRVRGRALGQMPSWVRAVKLGLSAQTVAVVGLVMIEVLEMYWVPASAL